MNEIDHWLLDPAVAHLNHGSYGACPKCILEVQDGFRREMESNPVDFLSVCLPEKLDAARVQLAAFVGAAPSDLVFVPNATTAVNAVLRSLRFGSGDQILATNHTYGACLNALRFIADTRGAEIVIARVPFPLQGDEEVTGAILDCVTQRTRLALIDHVTSPTALVFPVAQLVAELQRRGVDVLVDGAHAPGMMPLSLAGLGAAYYTGNAHKWLCAPKGAAFLYVRPDKASSLHPAVISHGYGRGLHSEFDWTGTDDPTAWLSIPAAIEQIPAIAGAGWPEIMAQNRSLALQGRRILLDAMDLPAPCPEEMIGSMSAMPLPAALPGSVASGLDAPGLYRWLRDAGYVTAVIDAPVPVLRMSAHLYNALDEYRGLAAQVQRAFRSG